MDKTIPVKITIINAQSSMWYNGMIGEHHTVFDTPFIYYKWDKTSNKIIFKCDVVVNG